jgi:hypothetical protein
MPLFLTWQYGISVAVAFLVVFLMRRAGVKYGLTPAAVLVMVGSLWLLGRHPSGFLVSLGGWFVFVLTLVIARALSLIVVAMLRADRPPNIRS